MRIARALGMTKGEMLARMSARELVEWEIFARLEPLGVVERLDWWGGQVLALLHNVLSSLGRSKRTYQPTEFYPVDPTPRGEKPKTGWRGLLSIAKAMASAGIGRIRTKR